MSWLPCDFWTVCSGPFWRPFSHLFELFACGRGCHLLCTDFGSSQTWFLQASQIANRTSRIALFQNRGLGIARISAMRSTKLSRIRVESQKVNSELPSRITTCQSNFAVTLESHDSNRTILKHPILDSESPILCH